MGGLTFESQEALFLTLTIIFDLDHVVLSFDGEFLAIQGEHDRRQRLSFGTIDVVDTLGTIEYAAQTLGDLLNVTGGTGDQRGTRVRDGLGSGHTFGRQEDHFLFAVATADFDTVQSELVISGAAQRDPIDLLIAVLMIVVAERDQPAGLVLGVDGRHPDGEERIGQFLLFDHILHRRHNLIDGQRLEAQAQNTVHRLVGEELGQVGGDAETIVDTHVTHTNIVTGDVSIARASTVLDFERLTVLLVAAALCGVEQVFSSASVLLGTQHAQVSSVQEGIVGALATTGIAQVLAHEARATSAARATAAALAAFGAGHPQVGAARVHHDGEGLGRRADCDVRDVCGIIEVDLADCIEAISTEGVSHGGLLSVVLFPFSLFHQAFAIRLDVAQGELYGQRKTNQSEHNQ